MTQDHNIKRIAVFCGSSHGRTDRYVDSARELGEEMVRRDMQLVYGGGNVGCMGAIATAVSEGLGKGSVTGVIPEALKPREISGDAGVHVEVITVADMHSRKAKMSELADAFIALPGGYGTLEEIIEMVTWQQLGIHTKPVGFLNCHGFYDHLLKFFDHCVAEQFVRDKSRRIIIEADTPADMLDKMQAYVAPQSLLAAIKEGKLDPKVRG